MAKITPRQAETIRLKVAREAVRENITTTTNVSLREAWARHLNLPVDAPVENVIAAMDGLIAEMERGS